MEVRERTTETEIATGLKRIVYQALGWACLILGILGTILPVMPGVIFIVLSAGFFFKSSRKMHHWVTENRYFGKYVKQYEKEKGISLIGKICALAFLWVSILISALFIATNMTYRLILLAVGLSLTIYLLLIKTIKK